MDYPSFRARGFPIGSGQVEGMNKSVIGNRLKRSGMQWSREGAARMASFIFEGMAPGQASPIISLRIWSSRRNE